MSLSVVLYAEGPADDHADRDWPLAPLEALGVDLFGPAHQLVARTLARERSMDPRSIRFLSPLRVRARRHAGSDLHSAKTLGQLVTFPAAVRRPALVVVLVDEDGDTDRRRTLIEAIEVATQPTVVAVAIREFEAWLIADQQALVNSLSVAETPKAPEGMKPREAKLLLQGWTDAFLARTPSSEGLGDRTRALRCDLARSVRFEVLDELTGFKRFRGDLKDALARVV